MNAVGQTNLLRFPTRLLSRCVIRCFASFFFRRCCCCCCWKMLLNFMVFCLVKREFNNVCIYKSEVKVQEWPNLNNTLNMNKFFQTFWSYNLFNVIRFNSSMWKQRQHNSNSSVNEKKKIDMHCIYLWAWIEWKKKMCFRFAKGIAGTFLICKLHTEWNFFFQEKRRIIQMQVHFDKIFSEL